MKRTLVAGVLTAALSLSACSSAPGTGDAAPSSTSPARSTAALKQALLSAADLPKGYAMQPEAEEGGVTPVARSADPSCRAFVRLINAQRLPGSKASAIAAFAGGNEGPFVEEWLEAMSGPAAVSEVQGQLRSSVADCHEVTVSLPGAGSAPMDLTAVPAPDVGRDPIGYRMAARHGALGGFEITFVHTGVGDTLLTMDFVAIDPAQIPGLLRSAHAKAAAQLKVSTP